MRSLNVLLTISAIAFLTSCEKDAIGVTQIDAVESVNPYGANTLSQLKGPQFAIIASAVVGDATPPISIRGIVKDMDGNVKDFNSFKIGKMDLPANLNDEDIRSGDATGQLYYTFGNNVATRDEYAQAFENIYGTNTTVSFESPHLGSFSRQMTFDKPVEMDLSNNFTITDNGTDIVSSSEGIKIKWKASKIPGKSSNDAFIAMVYHASRSQRVYNNVSTEPPSHLPNSNMTYSVVTENDGEHTIDLSNIQNFPSGGVYTITVGTATQYIFNIDDSNNTISITSAALDTSDDIIIVGCDDAAGNPMLECDCVSLSCY